MVWVYRRVAMTIAALLVLALAVPAVALAQDGPTLQRIVAAKTFVIAYRPTSPPLSYVDADGKPLGYSIDICLRIAEAIREEFKLERLAIRYVPVTAMTRIPLIANATADIECGTATITYGRMRTVDFLNMTFITGSKILVKKASGIARIEDMNGKILAASLGTTNEAAAVAEIERKGLKVEMVKVRDHPQAVEMLKDGRVDGYISDDVVLYGLKSLFKNPGDFDVVGPYLSYDPFGMIVARNDQDFRLLGNRVIARMIASGEMAALYKKWFLPGPTGINYPMNERLAAAFDLFGLPE